MNNFAVQDEPYTYTETGSGWSRPRSEHVVNAFAPIFFKDSMTTTSGVVAADFYYEMENNTTPGTSFHLEEADTLQASAEVSELRMLSGLTWDHLATLFDVSKRSLHFWASGKKISAANLEKLNRVLAAVSQIDTGMRSKNRNLILGQIKGQLPFDLLKNGFYDEFIELIGKSSFDRSLVSERPSLSAAESIKRRPAAPEMLVDSLQNKAHKDVGKRRSVKAKRARKRDR